MYLLTAPIVKNSHILARKYFTFLKKSQNKTERLLIPNSNLSEKVRKAFTKEDNF